MDGVTRYSVGLLLGLMGISHDFDLTVLVRAGLPGTHDLRTAAELRGATIVDVPASVIPSPIRLWPVFRHLRPGIYHHPNFTLPFSAPTPSVVTIYDAAQQVLPSSWLHRAAQLLYFKGMTAYAVRRASLIIAISRPVAEGVTRIFGADPERIAVIEPGIDPRFGERLDPEQLLGVRRRLGLTLPAILYVGTNWPHKNLRRLVQAFANIAALVPHELVLAGEAIGESVEIDDLGRQLGVAHRIRRLGVVSESDLRALYQIADVYVLCSLFEGFGMGVLEAMASGAPVLCSRQVSVTNSIKESTVLVDALKVDGIAEGLLRLCSDAQLREGLRRSGRAEASRYTWDRAAAATIVAYERALGAPLIAD